MNGGRARHPFEPPPTSEWGDICWARVEDGRCGWPAADHGGEMNALESAIDAALAEYDWITDETRESMAEHLAAVVDVVPVMPQIPGNGSMDGVTPILFFEAGSRAMAHLSTSLAAAQVHRESIRVTIDDGLLKWKVGEDRWSSGYPTERPNGGNG
jgi:hypothetical protein